MGIEVSSSSVRIQEGGVERGNTEGLGEGDEGLGSTPWGGLNKFLLVLLGQGQITAAEPSERHPNSIRRDVVSSSGNLQGYKLHFVLFLPKTGGRFFCLSTIGGVR